MKVPYSWIKEFIDINKPAEEVVEKLNETGLEASLEKFGEYIPNLITAKVLEVKKHPERDKLFICKATDGNREYQIITGADNVKENAVVILAKIGANIKGITIKERNFGSYKSEGMFLSLEELGIAESSEGIFLLPEDTPIGVDASKLLGLGEDFIIEIDITPNRADALSVIGVAREIGAIYNIKRKKTTPNIEILNELSPEIEILTNKCNRYRGVIIKGVEIKPSNLDITLKLIKSGQKPINNVVDITNYILLQEGQPLHAFDLDKIKGKVIVRNAKKGEKIVALDGKEYTLEEGDIVIADEEKPIAIAGIIGGENTKVDENTKNILLEGAHFNHIAVRKTAKRLAISTESSYRFERGVDIEHLPTAQNKAVELIIKLAGGKAVGEKDIYPNPYKPREIKLREITTKRILGINIPKEEAKEYLNRLEIPTELTEDGTISKIPAFRSLDLEREIDLVEEVGRLKGFNQIEEEYPRISTETHKKPEIFQFETRTRDFLRDNGLTEVVSYSFVSEELYKQLNLPLPKIVIENAISKDFALMRDNLAVSLLRTYQENIRHQIKDISIFEIGSTFFDEYEEIRAGILVQGKFIDGFSFTKDNIKYSTTENWDFLKLKGLIFSYLKLLGLVNIELKESDKPYLNQYESAEIYINNQNIGYLGKIHPKVAEKLEIPKNTYLAELKLRYVARKLDENPLKEGYLFTIYKNKGLPKYRNIPKFPAVKRDLAFEIPENISVESLIKAIKESSSLLDKVSIFDIFYLDENRKSVAVSVEFREENRSLSDEEVNIEVENLINKLKEKIKGLKLRA